MKKLALLFIVFIWFIPFVSSQPCLPEGIIFETQAQIDSFQILYPNCTEIEGSLIISGDNITHLNGLNVLTSIGNLQIISNLNLEYLSGLNNLSHIGASIHISGNDALINLTGLENISFIEGGLSIGDYDQGNPSLTSLTGLNNLSYIFSVLLIMNNNSLNNLTALENLDYIGYGTFIKGNHSLTSLTGLENTTIYDTLCITDNIALTICDIESICDYLIISGENVYIENNANGCNSPEEVQDSCEAHAIIIDKYLNIEGFSVSPNPFTTTTTLSYTLDKPSTVSISIFNPQGQLIEKIEQEQPKGEQQVQWNAKGLPSGMYYFRIQAGDKVVGGKMVKME